VNRLSQAYRFFSDRFLTVDPRTLGLFRIAFGVLLLANLYDRTGGENFVSFYTNEGVLPNHYALFLPPAPGYWSLLLGLSSPTEMRFGLAVVWVVYLLYTLGWHTRWMQVLVLICVESVNNRFILIQHGGNVVVNIMAVWTLFLPLGDRFSLDALMLSLRRHREGDAAALNARAWSTDPPRPHVGLAYFGICFNFAAIYFFNALHKIGGSWQEGSVIHWVLWQNRMATALAAFIRDHEPAWFSPALTWGTLVMEWALPLLILTPFLRVHARAVAVVFVQALHGGIAMLCTLGPFSYSMMVTSLLLVQREHWELARAYLMRRRHERLVRYRLDLPAQRFWARVAARLDALGNLRFEEGSRFEVVVAGKALTQGDGVAAVARALPLGVTWSWAVSAFGPFFLWLLRTGHRLTEGAESRAPRPPPMPMTRAAWSVVKVVLPALLLVAVVSQLLKENWGVHPSLKVNRRPEWMTAVIDYLTIPQGWSMFAPDPPREDARLVVDAVLDDGSHLDLLTGQPPDFEPWKHGPWYMDQHWCELHGRMRNWGQHWRNFRDFLVRRPRQLGWREDLRVVDFEVFSVISRSPAFGEREGTLLEKKRLFGMRDWPL
jgi:hypothetical protein